MTIERVPYVPGQYQLGVTELLTGIEFQPHFCAICGRNRGISLHHLVWRSHGGHAGPLLPVCLGCHNNLHDRIWDAFLEEDGIRIVERATGEMIWRLKSWPIEVEGIAQNAGDLIHVLGGIEEATRLMPLIAPALQADEALEVYRALQQLGEGSWKAQCRLIGEMFVYRFVDRTKEERISALSEAFGLRRSQLYNLLTIARAFGDSPLLDDSLLGQRYFIEAARTEEPEAWLRVAEERKLTTPSFSSDDLREEIARAGARKTETPAAPTTPPAPQLVWAKCPHCGTTAYMEKLPVGSDGQSIRIEDYIES